MKDLKHFKAKAIIFDKDGTLIDFDAMWGGWVIYLAEQYHLESGNCSRKIWLSQERQDGRTHQLH
jgi:phosphoglycolate phosphatase-like HAD superfamily hydrolase